MSNQSLFISILNRGKAETFLNEMRAFDLTGGIVMRGEGTATNRLLKILGLAEIQKEVIILPILDSKFENPIHEMMLNYFRVDKKKKGIAFSMPLSFFERDSVLPEGKMYKPECFSHQCLFVIVDEGKGHEVMQYAQEVKQTGGTIIHGHGAGVPSEAYFPFQIELQKDVVLILVKRETAVFVQDYLSEKLNLSDPAKGIMFSLPVSRVTGSFQE